MLCFPGQFVIKNEMNTKEFKDKILSLSDRIYPMVARILENNIAAEDAVQEIMIKLWDNRKQIGKHPNISGFVFLTARNYCIDLLKKKKIELLDSTFTNNETDKELSGSEQLELQELHKFIEDIITNLPEQQKEAILLRDIDGLEYSEIATITGLKIEHIRVLLSRARKYVGIELSKIYSYEKCGH